ncbi:hypothetical protein QVN99_15820, partial [Bacteroides caecigallinarum]
RSYTLPTCGTGMTGEGGVTVGCVSMPTDRSPNLATGMPGTEGRAPARPDWSLSRAAFEAVKRSEKPRTRLELPEAGKPEEEITDIFLYSTLHYYLKTNRLIGIIYANINLKFGIKKYRPVIY